ncbi:MAG: MerR family transcriptional regulator [Actinomycetales bacterium]|nr:MerR family transcriptional regulator [Actinomycetales bacterium]
MNIGEVLAALRPEFPDISISKIRFLEERGLVDPERTPSGYRKFSHADVERLRFVLSRQRDHYLPLRVIREYLDALDQGLDPEPLPGGPLRGPRLVTDPPEDDRPGAAADVPLQRDEVLARSGADTELLTELESYGLVAPRPGTGHYGEEAVAVAEAAVGLAAFGVGPRHLRAFRSAADREAGLVEQIVAPLRRQRGTEAAARAEETTREVAALCVRLHAALVRAALGRGSG